MRQIWLWRIIVAVLVVMLIYPSIRRRWSQSGRLAASKFKDVRKHRNLLRPILSVVICEALFAVAFPHWYSVLAQSPWFWADHGIVGAVVLFFRKEDTPYGNSGISTAGGWILTFLVLANLVVIVQQWPNWCASSTAVLANGMCVSSADTPTFRSSRGSLPAPFVAPPNQIGADEQSIRYFFSKTYLPDKDRKLMIQHAWDESRFNQFGTDGKPLRTTGRNRDGSYDVGAMQINSKWIPELKAAGYDPETLEGNLNAALYVLQRQGHNAWAPWRHEHLAVVVVPVGKWCEQIPIENFRRIDYDGDVWVSLNQGPPFRGGPNIPQQYPRTAHFVSYQSRTSRPVHAFVMW